jgi:transcriptional regulator with XRE-family HTH domain
MVMRSRPSSEPELGALIGSSIKAMRLDMGWTEREFAARLRTNQAAVQRLEAGRQRHIDSRLATAALHLLGIRVTIDSNTPGRAARHEQQDAVHARCVGFVARQLTQRGWEVRSEVEIGEGRYRGWIDLLGYRASDGAILVIEVKTQIDDFGRILRSLGWYVRSSRDAARSLGWRPRMVVTALIALATVETDARLAANLDLIRNDLPGPRRLARCLG